MYQEKIMEYINSPDFKLENTAIALGKFEGLHRGHQLLLDEIQKQKNKGLKSAVFTFDMPPKSALSGDRGYEQIYTKEERKQILARRGIDILIEHPFTKEFSSLCPEDFIRKVLVEKAGAKAVVVGTDFRFGKKRSGGIEHLQALSKELGYELIVLHKLTDEEGDISSTRIRELIASGDMEKAEELLGRPCFLMGKVIHGKELGRTIQIPTVNQKVPPNKLTPPNGVYVSRIGVRGKSYYGITNIGVKPTVENENVKGIETNIFDFNENIYDETIVVELLHYKRPEQKFTSVEELKTHMMDDIAFAKEYIRHFDEK